MFGQTHGKQKQFTKVSPEHCKITKVSTSNYSEFGPDLAFVEIPAPFAASLQAKLSTVDWLLESQKGLNSEPTQKKISGLMGMMEALDNSEPTKVTETEKIFTHQARINLGAVTECMNNFANYDLFDFTIHVNEREAPLPSFGGTSGGPVWRFFIEKDDAGILSIKESRLLGIAFWEHGTGPPVIRCHGPRSIHQILLNKVQQRVC